MRKPFRQYATPRIFVGLTRNGRREILRCSTNRPAKRYLTEMIGPFRTLRAARFYIATPTFMLRSVAQVERLALELEQKK